MTEPVDGSSIFKVFSDELAMREKLIPFKFQNNGALIDNNYKLDFANNLMIFSSNRPGGKGGSNKRSDRSVAP